MSRRGAEIEIGDFSGGLHTATAVTEVHLNEAYDLSNMIVGPGGSYARSRFGNTAFNAAAMSSGVAVQGLGYFKQDSGTDHLVAVCGTKIFESTSLDGTMNDITGAVTVSTGQNNIWTQLTFNNLHLGFGGSPTAPDAPWKYSGTGTAAALAGTPPSAYGAVQANNRVFAFRTAANPSIVQWCVLGNPNDWTGVGSGSQNISTSDNDSVNAMAIMSNSVALVFKNSSVHKMLISTLVSGAFPQFPLFPNTGCVGKHSVVVADGLCYFINAKGFMQITDGVRIIADEEIPRLSNTDDIWSSASSTRTQYIQGVRRTGTDYDHIVWFLTSSSSGSTNDWAMIWDLQNRCWLRNKTGFKSNVATILPDGRFYTGHYNGVIYKQEVSGTTTDASETSANVDSYWTSGWNQFGSFQKNKGITEAYISFVSQILGNLQFSWGYNFNSYTKTQIIDQRINGGIIGQFIIGVGIIGGQSDYIKRVIPIGNGQVFQYRFRNNDSKMKINRLNLIGTKFTRSE